MTPSSTISGIEPSGYAMTGVPQAIASTTDSPNGSANAIGCSSAARRAEHARRGRAAPTEPEVADARRRRRAARPARGSTARPARSRRSPGGGRPRARSSMASAVPLSGWIRPNATQSRPLARRTAALRVDAVVDRRRVVELRRAIGVGDRHEVRRRALRYAGKMRGPRSRGSS